MQLRKISFIRLDKTGHCIQIRAMDRAYDELDLVLTRLVTTYEALRIKIQVMGDYNDN